MDAEPEVAAAAHAVARRAVPADAAELTRLRGLMFEAIGTPPDDSWQPACRAVLAERLAGDDLVAFVVEAPDGDGLASGVVGFVERRLPGPGRTGLVGHVSSVSTDPAWRRRGMARLALEGLLRWFDHRGLTSVTLSATEVGEGLYRSLGFREPQHPTLRRDLRKGP